MVGRWGEGWARPLRPDRRSGQTAASSGARPRMGLCCQGGDVWAGWRRLWWLVGAARTLGGGSAPCHWGQAWLRCEEVAAPISTNCDTRGA
ncbi:hypothetical protein NDU88_007525 [Pleurodeles waltl]|uniref:Uncharacterized protein n=1 Tax=Pleurodeles waltl TaxID=8319 RepID=A0AAV7VSR6_PLEWA|nr:hypothetical protein NDU88_007525 [Pleurodeles waltl]